MVFNEKIAIIGIGIIAPDAANKEEFWNNILSKRNCISEVPKDRWDPELYYDPDPKAKDKTYSKIGGFIKNFKFDPVKYRIPPISAPQIGRLQQLTIEATRMALEDAGYKADKWNIERVGVIIANAMGAMRKEFTDLRVYKFFNEDVISKTQVFKNLSDEEKRKLFEEYERYIDEYILAITEDTMPGELANVTSGRIANVFNFKGPNLIIDAACASSLAALDYAVMALRTGKIDIAVCGGADEMMSPAAYVKFCKIGALSANGSFPFDKRADGFVMGEAVAIYILKRLSDAVRDGDRIYAVINSVGASSDGKGKGITAPNPSGQKLAIENAFREVDYGPGDVDWIECHGTATRVGDATECAVLKEIFQPHLNGRKLMVSSVKSNIGHTKAAAGAVSLVKAALSIYNKIIPPSANFEYPNPNIDFSVIDVVTEPRQWVKNGIRRVNVSSFGFGGTNFHAMLEEYVEGKTKYSVNSSFEKIELSDKSVSNKETSMTTINIIENKKAPFSLLQGETFTLTAKSPEELLKKIENLKVRIQTLPDPYPQTIISVELNSKAQNEFGISIVSKSPKDLVEKIDFVIKNYNNSIFESNPLNFKLKGIYPFIRKDNYKGKIGFVFPGQGSQYVDMMRDLAMKYDVVMDTFREADRILEKMIGVKLTDVLWSKEGETKEELLKREDAIRQTQMTQPAVMTADMAMFRLLTSFGIKPDMVMGHSLGEYAAATAAGIFTLENGLRAVTSRAKEMSNIKVKDPGKMAAIAWPSEKVEEQLKKIKGYVVAANKNCPIQTVIAGEKEAVDEAIRLFKALGVEAQEINVSHAFHSEIIRPAIEPYREFLRKIPIKTWDIPILSNVTADFFPQDVDSIYELLVKQMVNPVEFVNQIKKMYDEGVRVFIECGPKRVLSAFVTETLKDKNDIFVLATNHPKRGGIYDFNDAIANLITVNFKLAWSDKFITKDSKFYNPYYLNWALSFINETNATDIKKGETSMKNTSSDVYISVGEIKYDAFEFAKNYGFNFNPIAISGIASGCPGEAYELFRERALDDILEGKNLIEPIPMEWRKKQIDKNVVRVIKSDTGDHQIVRIESVDDAIKLSARKGRFDIVKEFGVPQKVADAMNSTFQMAFAAGILALKDAHIPLIHYYRKTTIGTWLPDRWALPKDIADETGVIFASAFPTMESIIKEVTDYFMDKYSHLSDDRLWEIYENIVSKLHSEEDKREIRKWMKENIAKFSEGPSGKYQFSQNFLLKVIPIADSQFAEFVGAKGPAIHLSAACASTTQSVHVAESWIRSGKCKRVVIIAADDITNELMQSWTMPGFLATGTATTKDNVEEAALPFDRRRHGLIVGSGAVALVIEDETEVRKRGVLPLARLLLTEARNSAYHITRLDAEHVAEVMNEFIGKVERIYGLKRNEIASKTLFVSHETYTPRRGGSASAEVNALKKTFGDYAKDVIVSNVKGFTGHTMGASIEDAIAVRALNTGIVPPIANYKEPDPELEGINLSKGGKYDLRYAIRFAAGFGSHMGISFIEKVWDISQERIFDRNRYYEWLKQISGYDTPELEVVNKTLRIKDKGKPGSQTAWTDGQRDSKTEAQQGQQDSKTVGQGDGQTAGMEGQPDSKTAGQMKEVKVLNEEEVLNTIINIISEKTGYSKDMLDPDLDMEADLGIDTVKQAELFGIIREHYGIPRREGLSLKDYPTIRHCVKFVMENVGGETVIQQGQSDSQTAWTDGQRDSKTEAQQGQQDIKTVGHGDGQTAGVEGQSDSKTAGQMKEEKVLSEEEVLNTIINIISEKTGYSKDMLDPDLDMEADLGIDTVKQAELFGMIREYYGIPRREGLSLKDYPTIRHCVKFVMENVGGETVIQQGQPDSKTARQIKEEFKVDIGKVLKEIENKHTRHIRYKPTVIESPVVEEIIKKIDPSKVAVIIGNKIDVIKSIRNEFSKLGVNSVVITESDTRMKDTYNTDFSNIDLTQEVLRDISSKYSVGGIVYLMGLEEKKLDENTNPSLDVKKYVLPLFLSAKIFGQHLNQVAGNFVSFVLVVSALDGGFGYITKENYDPIYAGIYGVGLCLRKEFEKSVVKVIDFQKDASVDLIVKKMFYELQYSDLRCAVSYSNDGKRYTLVGIPVELKKQNENFSLSRKKVIITGGGRGLGALFAKIASYRWKPTIIILDIIELGENAVKFASMSDNELNDYKNKVLKEELKSRYEKVTPVILEKEFTKIKDSANLYKTIKEIEILGAKVYYYQCDLNNPIRFEEVTRDIKEKFGPVDGLIHFAGLERSKLAVDKSIDEFMLIFNTKANSAINIWKSGVLKDNALVVMISSIAGKFGNIGQTDYAAASDYISKFAVNLFNQGRKAFAIDMTAIANIGMGTRPGVEAFLKSQEVEFLYPEEVMNTLADDISYGDIPEVIYSGSLGKLDWDKQLMYEKDFPTKPHKDAELYFIEKVEMNSESRGFVSVKKLSVSERYLEDHSINDTPVFPGVMGLESFAQGIIAYMGVYPKTLKNIEFKLPIKLLKKRDVEVRLNINKNNDILNLSITSDFVNSKGIKIGDTRTHFVGVFDFKDEKFINVKLPKIKEKYKADKDIIYKTYFHGHSFQVLDGIIEVNRDEVIGVFRKPSVGLLGDKGFKCYFHPMIIEALFQTCGWRDIYVDDKMTLPDSIESVSIIDNGDDPDKLYTYAVFRGLNNYGKSVYNAWAFDENGKIYVQLLNYVMINVNIL